MNVFEDEVATEDVFEGQPDTDRPRHFEGVQDDGDAGTQLRTFMAPDQRTVPEVLDWYNRNHSSPPFDPDGMCQKICRYARNIAARYASAKESQDATPMEHRVYKIADLRQGHVAYFDTAGDSNPFGHIVTVVGRVPGVDRSKLESLIVWTNSVKANELVKVRGNYFRDHWGDEFKFGATWLNGQELKMPALTPPPASKPEPTPVPTRLLHIMHASLQVQDTRSEITSDVNKIFRRAEERKVSWLTGTEAFGPRVVNVLEAAGARFGYRVERPAGQDSWIAVAKSLISGNFNVHWEKIVEGGATHRDLGVFCVDFDTKDMGHFWIYGEHLLTRHQPDAAAKNLRVTRAVGAHAREANKQKNAKLFYGSDKNLNDRTKDTFMGFPWTSLGDELKKWESTGYGPIDVMATYDADGKVSAKYIRALDDTEFKLYGDHFLVEGGVNVQL